MKIKLSIYGRIALGVVLILGSQWILAYSFYLWPWNYNKPEWWNYPHAMTTILGTIYLVWGGIALMVEACRDRKKMMLDTIREGKKMAVKVKWSEEDNSFVATCDKYPLASGFGDFPEDAIEELKIAVEAMDEIEAEDNK